jgi:signal transduction histidine kinase/ActR/RegA family two-component response regulator
VKLRNYLALLALGAILPVALFGAIVGSFMLEHNRATFQRGAQERALAMMTAVDAEIGGSIATAEALGASLDIDSGDFQEFREVAQRILRTQPDWSNINLALPSGQQVVNLQRPEGAPLHSIAGVDDSLAKIHATHAPVVNDVAFGQVTRQWDIAVRVPVVREGELKYILSVIVKPESIANLLLAQGLPSDWVGVVVDRKGRVVARTRDAEAFTGELASQTLREKIARAPSGWYEGTTLEGNVVHTAHQRSALTGWTFAMAIPAEAVGAAAWRAAGLLGLGLLAAVGIALVLTGIIGRRVSRPIAALATAAEAIGRGQPAQFAQASRVAEIDKLASAMDKAAEAVRERQQLIEREKSALQTADRAKDEFIAMLSHELRNPLAALTAAAHLLKVAGAKGEAGVQVQGVIERQTQQMTRLVEDLLDVSRVTMGKASLQRENFDLSRAVQSVAATWRTSGRLERHAFSLETTPVWVHADRARVEQILSNLLDNALKFTPAGKAVRVAVRQEGGEAVLEVADAGEGLAPGLAQRLFGLFVQGQSNLDRSRGGMGIGLALVKRLAEMHGGDVTAESAGPGLGSTFRVRLPAITAPAKPSSRQAWSRPRRALRILVVEDNDDARRMLGAALAHEGHEVRTAASGASALAQAAELHPEVALIDIGLPDLDGFEVARRLRAAEREERAALVALTGYGQSDDRRRTLEAGFDAHLVKPVSTELLLRAVGAVTNPVEQGPRP